MNEKFLRTKFVQYAINRNMKYVIIFFIIVFNLTGCLVSRLARPKLTGYIFDADTKKPVPACKVGEAVTDNKGYYVLDEKRYMEFTFIGMEAPPVFVSEKVVKKGYKIRYLKASNKYGGGLSSGTHWKMPPVYLRKNGK